MNCLNDILEDLGINGEPFAEEVREIWGELGEQKQKFLLEGVPENRGKPQVVRGMLFAACLTGMDLERLRNAGIAARDVQIETLKSRLREALAK